GARRGDDDVGLLELAADLLQRDRDGAQAACQLLGPVERPVRDERDPRPPGEQVPRRLLADLAGPDEQDRPARQIAEHLLGERRRGGRHRRRALADRRLRPHLAPRVQRLAEEAVEQRRRRARLVGRPDLAEDLALSRHERVETGGNAEEVQRGGVVVEPVERLLDLRLELGQRLDREPLRRGAVRCRHVELGAVAGREADRLAEPPRERGRLPAVERDTLPELDRGVMVRGADEDETHQAKWVAGRASRTTITSTKPARATYAARRPAQPRSERRTR